MPGTVKDRYFRIRNSRKKIASIIANAEDGIQRNGSDIVFKAEILLGDPNGISRFKQPDIFIQTGCGDVRSAFHFYRDDLAFQRDHKVNLLGALVISPEIRIEPRTDKLCIYIVFCHAAFEIGKFFLHEEDVICPDSFLRRKEPHIRKVDLEIVYVLVIIQRFCDLFRPVNSGQKTCGNQPFNGVFVLCSSCPFFDDLVLKARVLFGQLYSDRPIGQSGLFYLVLVPT